jgi:hypothetical protein
MSDKVTQIRRAPKRRVKLSLWIGSEERAIILREAMRLGVSMSDAVRILIRRASGGSRKGTAA